MACAVPARHRSTAPRSPTPPCPAPLRPTPWPRAACRNVSVPLGRGRRWQVFELCPVILGLFLSW
jgi:hypothetical protein